MSTTQISPVQHVSHARQFAESSCFARCFAARGDCLLVRAVNVLSTNGWQWRLTWFHKPNLPTTGWYGVYICTYIYVYIYIYVHMKNHIAYISNTHLLRYQYPVWSDAVPGPPKRSFVDDSFKKSRILIISVMTLKFMYANCWHSCIWFWPVAILWDLVSWNCHFINPSFVGGPWGPPLI